MANGAVNVDVATSDYLGPVTSGSRGMFDSSGWTVATGSARASGEALPQWAIYAALAVVVLLVIKRKRRA